MSNAINNEKLNELKSELESVKRELHEMNQEKMRQSGSGPSKDGADRALENCRKISSIVREVDPWVAQKLDEDIRNASNKLGQTNEDTIYNWYKEELTPLLNKSEQLGHVALEKNASP